MKHIVPVLFTRAALPACPPNVPVENACAVELASLPFRRTHGGHLVDGRWSNRNTVIDEQSEVLAIPVEMDTLHIADEITAIAARPCPSTYPTGRCFLRRPVAGS